MVPFGTTINKCLPDKYNRSKDPYDIRQQKIVTTNDVQQYTLFIIPTAFKQKQITIQCILYPPYGRQGSFCACIPGDICWKKLSILITSTNQSDTMTSII